MGDAKTWEDLLVCDDCATKRLAAMKPRVTEVKP
jgi:hypothetical protein